MIPIPVRPSVRSRRVFVTYMHPSVIHPVNPASRRPSLFYLLLVVWYVRTATDIGNILLYDVYTYIYTTDHTYDMILCAGVLVRMLFVDE